MTKEKELSKRKQVLTKHLKEILDLTARYAKDELTPGDWPKLVEYFETEDSEKMVTEIEDFMDWLVDWVEAERIEKNKNLLPDYKMSMNTLNVMLTTKIQTLNKIDREVQSLRNHLKKESDPKRQKIIKRQIKEAIAIHIRCKKNFPENYNFTVYEQYALFGGYKILSDNKFKAAAFYFVDLLNALNFQRINKREITEVKKAMLKLSKDKFPCYMVFPDKDNSKKFHFYDGDEPIFKIRPVGTLDLNLDIEAKDIKTTKLYLSLQNPALIQDVKDFYTQIGPNLFSNLREYKRGVHDWDLYFVEFLIKDSYFYNHKNIRLNHLCYAIKKYDFLDENKNFNDRRLKLKFKNMIRNLSEFSLNEKLIEDFSIEGDSVFFKYQKKPKSTLKELRE